VDGIEPEKKKITLTFIMHYFFGAIFLLFGIVEIAITNYISGLFFILAATLTIPESIEYVENKFSVSISNIAKVFVIFCFTIGAFAAIPTPATDSNNEAIASAPSDVSNTETISQKAEQAQTTDEPKGSVYVAGTYYKCGSWSNEQYPLIRLFGENYVPLHPDNEKIWSSRVNKLAKLVLDLPTDGGQYTLRRGETLDLGEGYCLEAKEVDVEGQKVWLEFTKDGQYVDDAIINDDDTWDISLNDIQGVNDVVVFKVHANQILQGKVDRLVVIDGIWLIDYANVKILSNGDKFGEFTLTKISNGADESNPGYLVFE